jgi:hypothetical protein
MGDWDRNASWNRDVLERIAALLFAFACLADLAAGAPLLRRRRVLGILSQGEIEARTFVMGVASGGALPADSPEQCGDAARLAASFRALAMLLCAMLARRFALPDAAGPRTGRQDSAGSARRQAPPPLPDTS